VNTTHNSTSAAEARAKLDRVIRDIVEAESQLTHLKRRKAAEDSQSVSQKLKDRTTLIAAEGLLDELLASRGELQGLVEAMEAEERIPALLQQAVTHLEERDKALEELVERFKQFEEALEQWCWQYVEDLRERVNVPTQAAHQAVEEIQTLGRQYGFDTDLPEGLDTRQVRLDTHSDRFTRGLGELVGGHTRLLEILQVRLGYSSKHQQWFRTALAAGNVAYTPGGSVATPVSKPAAPKQSATDDTDDWGSAAADYWSSKGGE
jgi:vacuolar-type H+-ATPase subunit I/STV1